MLDICSFKLHAGVRGGIHQSWWFLLWNFCILLYSLSIWFVYLFLLLLHHLDSGNLWPSFLLSFFFPGLKNLIPFSSLRHLIQLLPSDSQVQPQLLPISFIHFKFLIPSLLLTPHGFGPPCLLSDGAAQNFLVCLSPSSDGKINSWWDMGSIASNVRGIALQVMSEELRQLSWLSFRIKN